MRCDFCFRRCDIKEGKAGFCGQRTASKGHVSSLNENMLCAVSIDPVEKKPLYHFLPNSMTFSVTKTGCSFDCDFCQNWQIAREWKGVRQVCVLPEDSAAQALSAGCPSISFTYTEPLVWQDYMLETAGKAAAAGLRTIMVSNGAFSSYSAQRVIPEIDAFNIDLKGDEYFYRKYCHGEYGPVIDGIREIVRCGRHLEVTTMVIEDIHTKEMIASLGRVLADAGVRVWHLTRFFPQRRMRDRKASSEAFLARLYEEARQSGISHVYRGNSSAADETVCPVCGKISGRRAVCPHCSSAVYGVFS